MENLALAFSEKEGTIALDLEAEAVAIRYCELN